MASSSMVAKVRLAVLSKVYKRWCFPFPGVLTPYKSVTALKYPAFNNT